MMKISLKLLSTGCMSSIMIAFKCKLCLSQSYNCTNGAHAPKNHIRQPSFSLFSLMRNKFSDTYYYLFKRKTERK